MAIVLKNYIVKNKLFVLYEEKAYVMVEGWQFAGGLLGLFPKIKEIEELAKGKWLVEAEIIDGKTGGVISTGFAICSKEESKKKDYDEYAILSMAQTRAIGKAYRNLIGWVMKLAGYQATPAEEIQKGVITPKKAKTSVEALKTSSKGKKVKELRSRLKGATAKAKLSYLMKKTGIKLKDFKITETHAKRLIAELLSKQVKR